MKTYQKLKLKSEEKNNRSWNHDVEGGSRAQSFHVPSSQQQNVGASTIRMNAWPWPTRPSEAPCLSFNIKTYTDYK